MLKPTLLRWAALPFALCWTPGLMAATGHGHDAPDHPPAPAEAAPAAPAHGEDPMSLLKARLQEKLGAVQAPDARGTHEVRVATAAPEPKPAPPHAPARAPAPSSAHASGAKSGGHAGASPKLVALVAAHRDGKEADSAAHAIHWDYAGEGAPDHWGTLKPEFSMCAQGQRQSPIDIRGGIAVDLAPVQFDYRPSGFNVVDNGHTVQVNLAGGNSIEVMGRRYELLQFHFHRPSEERINGRQYDLSVHLVHKDPEGRLAVVAVLLERGAAQSVVQQVWNNLPLEKNAAVMAPQPLDPSALLPTDRRYFTYMGSLTTPPCTEGVLWMVMQQTVPASIEQIGIFQRLYPMNARPVQATAGRLIKQSN